MPLTDTFIYSERWMNSTEQHLRRQRQTVQELRDKLRAVKQASAPEWSANLSYTLSRVDRLEGNLRKTSEVLEQFRERVEILNQETMASYAEALTQAQHPFS